MYLNGLLWSSAADIMIISAVSAVVCFVSYLLSGLSYYLVLSGLFALLVVAFRLLIPVLTRRHVELGNEQIDFIHDLHSAELHSRLKALAELRRQ